IATPERDFWPLMPRPAVLPMPEPGPRPTRLAFFVAPGLSRSSLSFMSLLLAGTPPRSDCGRDAAFLGWFGCARWAAPWAYRGWPGVWQVGVGGGLLCGLGDYRSVCMQGPVKPVSAG